MEGLKYRFPQRKRSGGKIEWPRTLNETLQTGESA